MLVVGIHLAESRRVERTEIDSIRTIMDEFLRRFPVLYSARHNTQSVHSLQHVADSVSDFGSLGNYSTFNFESILGKSIDCKLALDLLALYF